MHLYSYSSIPKITEKNHKKGIFETERKEITCFTTFHRKTVHREHEIFALFALRALFCVRVRVMGHFRLISHICREDNRSYELLLFALNPYSCHNPHILILPSPDLQQHVSPQCHTR